MPDHSAPTDPRATVDGPEQADGVVPDAPRPAGRLRAMLTRRRLLQLGVGAAASVAGAKVGFDAIAAIVGTPAAAAVDPVVAAYDPTAHRWGMVVDATRCIGCGRCVVACKEENNVPLDGEHARTWVERHSVAADGTVAVDAPEGGINGFGSAPVPPQADGPATEARFVPRLCMQCENSPCTVVCPVGATYRRPDGVVLIDADRCIGCGYCIVACPYGARYLVPAGARTPAGVAGVADKCTFCYHRITRGQEPACVEVCPVGARIFGDLADSTSRVSTILAHRPTRVMREALGTRPRVHYLGLDDEAGI